VYALGALCLCHLWLCSGDASTFFIERESGSTKSQVAGEHSIVALQSEIAELRAEIRKLSCQNQS
jgi:hypothetical protein